MLSHTEVPTVDDNVSRSHRPSAPLSSGPRYVVGQSLGQGGMGEVLAARDTQIGREVAIKRLHELSPSSHAVARFLREARIQGRLEHPAIPPVHEVGLDSNGRPYFAMKKLSGTSLSDILHDPALRLKFSRQRLLRAFVEVCLAIEFAHTQGVLHRDLKPTNVLLGEFGEVYVIDWGVARLIGDRHEPVTPDEVIQFGVTVPGAAVGTPGYMAPEQVLGHPDVDARIDVYALGCVLYEILAAAPLHPRGTDGMRSALGLVDARPSRVADDVPPELDELCVRATEFDRDYRLGTARELGEAVQRYLDGDRDLAQRAEMACNHLATAAAAISVGDTEASRQIAMREAGRALALDPSLDLAATLIGRLMLVPPKAMPRVVATELKQIDRHQIHKQSRVLLFVHVSYVVLGLTMVLLGTWDPVYIPLLIGLSSIAAAVDVIEGNTGSLVMSGISLVCNTGLVALFARMFSPFFIAPAIAVIWLMGFAFHPLARRGAVFLSLGLGLLAIVGMWLAEVIGWLSPTIYFGSRLELCSPILGIGNLPTGPMLCGYVTIVLAVAAVWGRGLAREQRAAREHLHVQAWQLRQLLAVPDNAHRR